MKKLLKISQACTIKPYALYLQSRKVLPHGIPLKQTSRGEEQMKKLYSVIALLVVASLALTACGGAATPTAAALKIGVVTYVGQLEDKSFNQAAYEGGKAAAEKLGATFDVIVTQNISDYKQNIQTFIEQGFNVIITVGFLMTTDTAIAAKANPNVHFIGVDQGICVDANGAPDP